MALTMQQQQQTMMIEQQAAAMQSQAAQYKMQVSPYARWVSTVRGESVRHSRRASVREALCDTLLQEDVSIHESEIAHCDLTVPFRGDKAVLPFDCSVRPFRDDQAEMQKKMQALYAPKKA